MKNGCLGRRAALLTASGLVGAWSRTGSAQTAAAWPSRPITIVVPWPAGGSTDTLVRLMAPRMAADLGQPVLVENRGGASGTVGHQFVARAQPDGYTVMVGANSTYAMAPHLMTVPYDNERAFAPLGLIAFNPLVLCVKPSVAARSLPELLALARARPGQITYASGGNGTSMHLGMELLMSVAKVEMVHVPYRGGGPATQALVAGEVDVSAPDLSTVLPFVRNGNILALGNMNDQRSPLLPEVPTVAEAAGLPGFRCTTDFAMFAPAGTPDDILRRVNAAALVALRAPEVRARLGEIGIEVADGTPEGFGPYFRRELDKWGGIVRERNIRMN